jgi:nucleotide-binding universal stress UspA family protein
MNVRPSVLCPVDYSDGSAAALRYAAAIAEHFVTRLIVLTIEDPLLLTAEDVATGIRRLDASERELATFVSGVFANCPEALRLCEYDVAVGNPAVEILRIARERSCDLVVMSARGATAARKLFFGSTTERVLLETIVPVLVTPPVDPGTIHVEDARSLLGRIIVPVDLSPSSRQQTAVARGLAEALSLPLVLVHVIEPANSRLVAGLQSTTFDSYRQVAAEQQLNELALTMPATVEPEAVIAFGDPAEEVARMLRDRGAGLVVIGLHGWPPPRPRMGSVTYRLLCLSQALMLAVPAKTRSHHAALASAGLSRVEAG